MRACVRVRARAAPAEQTRRLPLDTAAGRVARLYNCCRTLCIIIILYIYIYKYVHRYIYIYFINIYVCARERVIKCIVQTRRPPARSPWLSCQPVRPTLLARRPFTRRPTRGASNRASAAALQPHLGFFYSAFELLSSALRLFLSLRNRTPAAGPGRSAAATTEFGKARPGRRPLSTRARR